MIVIGNSKCITRKVIKLVKSENECLNCGLQCSGHYCPNYSVSHYYCDNCTEETQLYEYEGMELCLNCIEKKLDKIN